MWKQKKPTPLDRGPPLHVNMPLEDLPSDWCLRKRKVLPYPLLLLLGPFYGDILETSFRKKKFNEAGMIANCNRVRTENSNHISKSFQGLFKDQVDFEGPSTKEYNQFTELQKCTFSVYSNKALRFELFASPILYIFQLTGLKLIVNYCIKHRALYVTNH